MLNQNKFKIVIEPSINEVISYTSYLQKLSLINFIKLSLESKEEVVLNNLVLRIFLSNFEDFIVFDDVSINSFSSRENIELTNFNCKVNENVLKNNRILRKFVINIELLIDENQILAYASREINLLPPSYFDAKNFPYEILASFINPNSLVVKNNVLSLLDSLKDKYGLTRFLSYYDDKEDLKREIELIYNQFLHKNIFYLTLPKNFLINGVNIRHLESVEYYKRGTPLDVALFLCSIFEYSNLNTILIFVLNKVYVGVWLTNETFSNSLNDDHSLFVSYLNLGRILTIDPVLLFEKKLFSENVLSSKTEIIKNSQNLIYLDLKVTRSNNYLSLDYAFLDEESSTKIKIDERSKELENFSLDISLKKEKIISGNLKFDFYQKKLLDYSKSNKLINMKIGVSSFELLVPSIEELTYLFDNEEENLFLLSPLNGIEVSKTFRKSLFDIKKNKEIYERSKSELVRNQIELLLDEKDYSKTLYSLYKRSKFDIEESGTNTLFITVGIFAYKDDLKSKTTYYAPILLYPVELIRKSTENKYYFKVLDIEPTLNVSFLNYIKETYKVDFSLNFEDLPRKEENKNLIDINKLFIDLKKDLSNLGNVAIKKNAFLGRFSFNKFVIWNDIKSRKDELMKNKIINSFVNGSKVYKNDKPSLTALEIDKYIDLRKLAIPLMADSSQVEAIVNATNGESFVLIGPPGTGKSQTIANIIANALYNDKKVLFCSSKKAALDVVFDRLKNIKLDKFILELHSNKQDKKRVLEDLYKTLEFGEVKSIPGFNNLIESLNLTKEELQRIDDAIHKKPNFYPVSLYEALINFEKNKENYNESLKINREVIENFNLYKKEEILNLLKEAYIHSKNQPFYKNNAFKVYKNKDYFLETKNKLNNLLSEFVKTLENFSIINDKISEILKLPLINEQDLNDLYSLFEFTSNNEVYLNLLSKTSFPSLIKDLKRMINIEDSYNKDKEKLLCIFDYSILDTITDEKVQELSNVLLKTQNGNFIKRTFNSFKIKKYFSKFSKTRINKQYFKSYFDLISLIKRKESEVKKNRFLIYSLIGQSLDYPKYETSLLPNTIDYKKILSKLDNTLKLFNIFEKISFGKAKKEDLINTFVLLKTNDISYDVFDLYKEEYNIISKKITDLETTFKFDFSSLDKGNFIRSLLSSLSYVKDHIDDLYDVTALNIVFERLETLGFKEIVDFYKNNEFNFDKISLFFEASLYKEISEYLVTRLGLEKFSSEKCNLLRDEYQNLDLTYRHDVISEIVSKLSKKIPTSYSENINSSEVAILKKAIKSLGRGISLRKLLSTIPSTIFKLKPCFLISPLSCAKYLDPKPYHFDIVIFDEASQLQTEETLGVISRGDSLIIAGDDKQLPPTSFFDKQVNDGEGEYYLNDLESVLDDAISISLPIRKLRYHYRSKSESLIAFSNAKFYQNELYTFPSSDESFSKINYNFVENGIYDSGKSATNKIEAIRLVDDLIKQIKLEKGKRTYGIITFSIHQMDLVDKLLTERIDSDKQLENIVSTLKEPIFIKNLENVQGDERDVIYISICYGRNKNGRFIQNFGPINNLGGERRLNVAITRSKEQMSIYTSIEYNDINVNKTNSVGVKYLRSFLEYAKFGQRSLSYNELSENNIIVRGIEYYLAKDIEKLGFDVKFHYGASKFKIDIAVISKTNNKFFVAGILLDSKQYIDTPTATDKNIIQIKKLESLKWNIIFVWSLDYFLNKSKILNEIEKRLGEWEMSIENNSLDFAQEEQTLTDVVFEKVKKTQNDAYKPYLKFSLKSFYSEEQFMNPQNREFIFKLIKNIIEIESPISETFLTKRLYELFQIKRKNKDNTRLINFFYSKLDNPRNYSYSVTNYFYFKNGTELVGNNPIDFYRKANSRDFAEISKEEVSVLIKDILKKEISVEDENLRKSVVSILGFKSKTRNIDNCLSNVFDYMMNELKILGKNKTNNYFYLLDN